MVEYSILEIIIQLIFIKESFVPQIVGKVMNILKLTERKICSKNIEESVRKVRIGDPPSERCTGVSALDCNATFQVRPQRGTQC